MTNRIRMEQALETSRVTRRDRKIELLRIAAAANNGILRLGVASTTLIAMGLCQAQPQHLPGYLIKIMSGSGEFTRVGGRGSGIYRWLPFEEDADPDLDAPASADCGEPCEGAEESVV